MHTKYCIVPPNIPAIFGVKNVTVYPNINTLLKILPDNTQQRLMHETMRAYSAACNRVSSYIYRVHDLNQSSLNKALYYELRETFALRSQMAQSVIKTVIARYKTVLANENEWLPVSFKRPEYDLVWNRDYYLTQGIFSVNTLAGRIRLPFHQEGMEKYFDGTWQFGTTKLVYKHKKWFLHIPMSKEIPFLDDVDVCNVTGVDLGINYLATTHDSKGATVFFPGREIKHRRAQYAKSRKKLQQRGTASARRRLKQIGSRENRWMQDVNHRVSKALVESQPAGTLFVLEDLTGVRSATERVALKNRYVSVSWSFFDLRKKLEYKAFAAGSKAIAVDPKHTSQTCPKCGHTARGNRNKKKHLFSCQRCGYSSNDDRIGAMNLHRKGIEYLSAVAAE